MFILLTFLLTGVDFKPTCLDSLTGKWTIGSTFLIFDRYSISWRPFKTVRIGIEGSGSSSMAQSHYDYKDEMLPIYDSEGESWGGYLGVGFGKYFGAANSFSPVIALFSGFNFNTSYNSAREDSSESSSQRYIVIIASGIEYFFSLYGKQLSCRVGFPLISCARNFAKTQHSNGNSSSSASNTISFYLPTRGSLSTWLCFHF